MTYQQCSFILTKHQLFNFVYAAADQLNNFQGFANIKKSNQTSNYSNNRRYNDKTMFSIAIITLFIKLLFKY